MSTNPLVAGSAYDAADEYRREIMLWKAESDSLDQDLKDKDKIEARILDLYRNNDLMRGLVEKHVDTIAGSRVILQCKPDYESLGATSSEAKAWCKIAERKFHAYADSPENWISADRSQDFTQMCRTAARSKFMTGEITCSREWRRSPLGYSTCFNLFSPSRLKTPKVDPNAKVFHGIEFDKYGAAVAYHIENLNRKGKAAGYKEFTGEKVIKRYPRYTRFGWLQMFHIYEPFKPEYPRGVSRLASVIKKMKQVDRYHEADLDKAIIATAYVFAVTSDEDPESVADMLSGANSAGFSKYAIGESAAGVPSDVQKKRDEILKQICDERYINVHGGKTMHLFNGEKVEVLAAPSTIDSSANFAKGHNRSIANGAGVSYEYGSGDYEGVSFAGGQMSLGAYEHSANIERKLYMHKFATLCFRSWLDEAIDKGEVPLLGNQPYFANKEAYARCEFSGSKRVHVDPVKNARATSINLANGTTSRTDVVNSEGGDMEQVMANRGSEAQLAIAEIRRIAEEDDLPLTKEVELSVAIDIVATKAVSTPDIVTESTPDE